MKIGFFSIIGLAFLVACPVFAAGFPWPDPKDHPRVILDADQSLGDYLSSNPDWFKDDFLVAGLHIDNVVYGQWDAAANSYRVLHDTLQYRHLLVGNPISGTTVLHELSLTQYPPNAVSMEDLSAKVRYLGSWTRDPGQQVVDLSDPLSRAELQSGIRNLWQLTPEIVRFVDNAAVHPMVAHMQPWAVYCENIKELSRYARLNRVTVIFNVFVRPWELSDIEIAQLVGSVGRNNAVSLPLPWSKSIKDNKNATGWAIYRYRQLLDSGLVVILIPSADAPEKELYEWLATWRRKTDRVYLALPFWKEPLAF